MSRSMYQKGLSSVELLITLFVAVAFLAAGHQLYNAVIKDSGAARQRIRASAIAQERLQQYAASIPSNCSASSLISDEPITPEPEDLLGSRITASYSCPVSSLRSLTKTQVTITYNNGESSVTHATYSSR